MKRGEIWSIKLDPTIGAEIQKTRPCIIVNDDAVGTLSLKVIVPLTDWQHRYDMADWMVKIQADSINNLTKDSAADCFQVRSVSTLRLSNKRGIIHPNYMKEIEEALAIVLKIN